MTMVSEVRYARSGDVNIAYRIAGDGPFDVVFIPGTTSHVELSWDVPFLRALFERIGSFARVIHFDKRGTGMSDAAPADSPLEVRMDDVRAVMDAAGSQRAAVYGVSEGAAMSILFAATYPERAWALVLQGGEARALWAHDYPWGEHEAEIRSAIDAAAPNLNDPERLAGRAREASPNATEEEVTAIVRRLVFQPCSRPRGLAMMAKANHGSIRKKMRGRLLRIWPARRQYLRPLSISSASFP